MTGRYSDLILYFYGGLLEVVHNFKTTLYKLSCFSNGMMVMNDTAYVCVCVCVCVCVYCNLSAKNHNYYITFSKTNV